MGKNPFDYYNLCKYILVKPAKRPSLCRLQSIRYVVYRLVVEERTSISKWFYVQFTVVGVRQMNVKRTDKVLLSHSRFGHYFCSNLYGRAPRGPRAQTSKNRQN